MIIKALSSSVNDSAIVNAAGTNRVDKFSVSSNGINETMAITGWYGSSTGISNDKDNPYSARSGLFGGRSGVWHGVNPLGICAGGVYSNVTFRPVIWN